MAKGSSSAGQASGTRSVAALPVRPLLLLLLLLGPAPASLRAQDLEPRTYTNIPVGQNFVGVGYAYSDGEINPAPSVPIRDIEITMESTLAAYVRSLDLWGTAGKFDVAWGQACMKGSGSFSGRQVSGDRCSA